MSPNEDGGADEIAKKAAAQRRRELEAEKAERDGDDREARGLPRSVGKPPAAAKFKQKGSSSKGSGRRRK